MSTASESTARVREKLLALRAGYRSRIDTIHSHARNPLEADSSEQAAQLGNIAVVSALENEATAELAEVDAALARLDAGTYGRCTKCGESISAARLAARPASAECMECKKD
ncbi:MAG: TraR/DksA family transcriptional regulator [Chromatiales bacterium]|nr:TraR/DksA family transcriptional regulator [Chromatiales bacterium]